MLNHIKQFITHRKIPTDYLFVNKNNCTFNESQFSIKVKTIFGNSVNTLRSFYLTDAYNTGKLNTERQKQEMAVNMRNSVDVFKHYIKFNEEDTH